jgi:hypothetical protein
MSSKFCVLALYRIYRTIRCIYMHNFTELSPSWEAPLVQLLNNFPTLYGPWRFITVFTRAIHWSLSWARRIQSIPPHPTSLRSILILSCHLHLVLISLLPSGIPPELYMHSSSSSSLCVLHVLPSHPPCLDHSNYIWRKVQVMKLLIKQFSPTSHQFIPLQSRTQNTAYGFCKKHFSICNDMQLKMKSYIWQAIHYSYDLAYDSHHITTFPWN